MRMSKEDGEEKKVESDEEKNYALKTIDGQQKHQQNSRKRPRQSRPKVLCLGVSFPDLQKHVEQLKMSGRYNESILDDIINKYNNFPPGKKKKKKKNNSSVPSSAYSKVTIPTVLDCVQRGILTQMDGRDLVRCLQTEKVCGVDVYTVSQEQGATYVKDRHVHTNFSRPRSFFKNLKRQFNIADSACRKTNKRKQITIKENCDDDNSDDGCQKKKIEFDQIILDYYWIPQGWDAQHWRRPFFQDTLISMIKEGILNCNISATTRKPVGRIYLPFCLHCFREVLICRKILKEYYNISFLRKGRQLNNIALWAGTQQIDAKVMQGILGKRLDQEEVYCTFSPCDVGEAMEDPDISRDEVKRLARSLEDFYDIRFIVLEPLICHADSTTSRSKQLMTVDQSRSSNSNAPFLGLVDPKKVQRGFIPVVEQDDSPIEIPTPSKSPRRRRVRGKATNSRCISRMQNTKIPLQRNSTASRTLHERQRRALFGCATDTEISYIRGLPSEEKLMLGACLLFNLRSWYPNTIDVVSSSISSVNGGARRIFCGWLEDWEKPLLKQNDAATEAKFLAKYGGLQWIDADNNKEAFIADRDELFYEDGEDGLGWCVNGIGEDGELEPWPIHLVVEEIAETEQAEEVEVFLRV